MPTRKSSIIYKGISLFTHQQIYRFYSLFQTEHIQNISDQLLTYHKVNYQKYTLTNLRFRVPHQLVKDLNRVNGLKIILFRLGVINC